MVWFLDQKSGCPHGTEMMGEEDLTGLVRGGGLGCRAFTWLLERESWCWMELQQT